MNRRGFMKAATIGVAAALLQKNQYTTAEEVDSEMESREHEDSVFEVMCYHHEIMEDTSYQSDMLIHSTARYKAAESWLKANVDGINKETLRTFLAKVYPEGFCGYSYEYRMGTLWSMVFDVSDGTLEIRFGPPPYNGWHLFTLDGPVGVREYMAMFPRKKT